MKLETNDDLNTDYIAIANAMIKFGGSFFKKIGEALLSADIVNRRKLLETYPAEFKRYASMSEKRKS